MARTRYGMDPESLALAGPQALAAAFRSGTEGMALGDRLASSALQREILRERERRTEEDRLLEATLTAQGGSQVLTPGGGASGGGRASSRAAGGVPISPNYAPRSFADYVADRISRQEATEGVNKTLAEYDALTGREARPFDAAPVNNPMESVGYDPHMVVTPGEAAAAFRRRSDEYGLDEEGVQRGVQDYENWNARTRADFGREERGLAKAEAQRLYDAQSRQRGGLLAGMEVALRERYPNLPDEKIAQMAVVALDASKEFAVPSGQANELAKTKESSKAEQWNASLKRQEYEEEQVRLQGARDSEYDRVFDDVLAETQDWGLAQRLAEQARSRVVSSTAAGTIFRGRESDAAHMSRTRETAKAPQMNASLNREESEEERALLKEARDAEFDRVFDRELAATQDWGRAQRLAEQARANVVSPTAASTIFRGRESDAASMDRTVETARAPQDRAALEREEAGRENNRLLAARDAEHARVFEERLAAGDSVEVAAEAAQNAKNRIVTSGAAASLVESREKSAADLAKSREKSAADLDKTKESGRARHRELDQEETAAAEEHRLFMAARDAEHARVFNERLSAGDSVEVAAAAAETAKNRLVTPAAAASLVQNREKSDASMDRAREGNRVRDEKAAAENRRLTEARRVEYDRGFDEVIYDGGSAEEAHAAGLAAQRQFVSLRAAGDRFGSREKAGQRLTFLDKQTSARSDLQRQQDSAALTRQDAKSDDQRTLQRDKAKDQRTLQDVKDKASLERLREKARGALDLQEQKTLDALEIGEVKRSAAAGEPLTRDQVVRGLKSFDAVSKIKRTDEEYANLADVVISSDRGQQEFRKQAARPQRAPNSGWDAFITTLAAEGAGNAPAPQARAALTPPPADPAETPLITTQAAFDKLDPGPRGVWYREDPNGEALFKAPPKE